MKQGAPSSHVEVEAKFLGDQEQYSQIISWFEGEGFTVDQQPEVHRIHLYFDAEEKLRKRGCRLRCVVAPGEWWRYDFKAEDPAKKGNTLETSIKTRRLIPLPEVVGELARTLGDENLDSVLRDTGQSARIILVMDGRHQKAHLHQENLRLEVSWDVLVPIISAKSFSEIEVELVSGDREAFDTFIDRCSRALNLALSSESKLERGLLAEVNL